MCTLRHEQEKLSALERKEEILRRQEDASRNYPLAAYQVQASFEEAVNIGISGDGTSSFIHMCGADDGASAWKPSMHAFPEHPEIRLWCLPELGTSAVRDLGLRHFDAIVLICKGVPSEVMLDLLGEVSRYRIPTFAVRCVDAVGEKLENEILQVPWKSSMG